MLRIFQLFREFFLKWCQILFYSTDCCITSDMESTKPDFYKFSVNSRLVMNFQILHFLLKDTDGAKFSQLTWVLNTRFDS